MVGSAGFEPATCRLGGGRSIQLSYEPFGLATRGGSPRTLKKGQPADFRASHTLKTKQFSERKSVTGNR